MDIIKIISDIGIVPVIKIENAKDAVPLAKALDKGGIPVAEITFRTAAAAAAIKAIAAEVPQVLLGAGTVLTTAQVDEAIAAGAKFIVTPGFNPTIVKYCVEKNIPITPGCSSPSDVERAIEFGLQLIKIFPAEAIGGLPYIKALAGPYGQMKFMPTGGVNADNLNSYLAFDKIAACGGSWMVKEELIEAGAFDKITDLCTEAVDSMLGFEVRHVGINMPDADAAKQVSDKLETLFSFSPAEAPGSFFSGPGIEVMKTMFLGKNGHIAIGANSVKRAMFQLERRGAAFDMDTATFDAKGNIRLIYLKGEMGGFAVHLVQK